VKERPSGLRKVTISTGDKEEEITVHFMCQFWQQSKISVKNVRERSELRPFQLLIGLLLS